MRAVGLMSVGETENPSCGPDTVVRPPLMSAFGLPGATALKPGRTSQPAFADPWRMPSPPQPKACPDGPFTSFCPHCWWPWSRAILPTKT